MPPDDRLHRPAPAIVASGRSAIATRRDGPFRRSVCRHERRDPLALVLRRSGGRCCLIRNLFDDGRQESALARRPRASGGAGCPNGSWPVGARGGAQGAVRGRGPGRRAPGPAGRCSGAGGPVVAASGLTGHPCGTLTASWWWVGLLWARGFGGARVGGRATRRAGMARACGARRWGNQRCRSARARTRGWRRRRGAPGHVR